MLLQKSLTNAVEDYYFFQFKAFKENLLKKTKNIRNMKISQINTTTSH